MQHGPITPTRLATLLGVVALGIGVLWPLGAGVWLLASSSSDSMPEHAAAGVVGRTFLWSISVALLALLPGLPAGHVLGRMLTNRTAGWWGGALTLLPLCLPGYAVFWCWWQSFGPESSLGAWAIRSQQIDLLRQGILGLALVGWCWPLIAWPVAFSRLWSGSTTSTLAALDGAGPLRRLALWIRGILPAAVLGWVLAGLLVASATVSFDLAQVSTLAFELRALDALGATPAQLIWYSAPSFLVALLCTSVLLVGLFTVHARMHPALSRRLVVSGSGPGLGWIFLVLLVLAGTILPVLLALIRIGNPDLPLFWTLYGTAVWRTLGGALIDGTVCALIAGLLYVQWTLGGRGIRVLGVLMAAGWLLVGRLPSATLAALVTGTLNSSSLGPWLYDSGFALVLAEVINLAGLGCLIALVVAGAEPATRRRVRRLDPSRIASILPGLVATLVLAGVVTAVFSLGELILATRLGVPGRERLAMSLLNAMHYQRPDTVMVGLLVLIGAGAGVAILLGRFISGRLVGLVSVAALCVVPVSLVPACSQAPSEPAVAASGSSIEVPHELVFGAPGAAPGLFRTPRGLAVDPRNGSIYVVDKTARIQHFTADGEFINEWSMPEGQLGRPVGISVAPDGRVFVPDTHYHRILVFDEQGNELNRFGRFGTGPGEFVYPTDVVFGPEGELYVSEYGTNDRIQVFDTAGRPLRAFGTSGREVGQFTRPQAMVFSPDHAELFIADSCNHRVVVVDRQGEWLRVLGGPGREIGQFCYPYGLDLLPDGSLLICEYGSGRLQRIDAQTGAVLGVYGSPGFKEGRLKEPWAVAVHDDRILVLDSGNARVQIGALR